MTERATNRWRVLTWNLHGSEHPNLELVAEVIEGLAPHVVALQEVRRHQAHKLAKRLGWKVRWARKHSAYSPLLWWLSEGHAVLSAEPMSHVVRTSLTPGVSTWTYRHRIVLAATFTRAHGALRLYCAHLANSSTEERIDQARRLADLVLADAPPVAAVAGDLNTHTHDLTEIVREFHRAGLRDPGGDCTNPALVPMQRLDIVLVPDRATITDQHTPTGGPQWSPLSDHLPVLTEFEAA